MTIDYRKVVTLTTYQSPYVEIIYNTNGYQVTDTVTRYTKPVFLIGGDPGPTPGTDIDNLPAVPGSSCFNTVTFPKDLGPAVTTNPTKIFDLRRNDCGTPTTIDLNPLN
mgnify:CR=1 FL=1